MGVSHLWLTLLGWCGLQAVAVTTCPGSIDVKGHGRVELINAKWNVPGEPAGPVDLVGGAVMPGMKGRTYFGKSCNNDTYSPGRYEVLPFMGKSLRWTTDMAGAGCGCNAALYLTSMRQCSETSQCFDHYCDANNVCGVRCAEIDLQEANMHAWHSTLHVLDDGSGVGAGYGGGDTWNGHRDFTMEDYGPNSMCIETTKPFQVEVAFPEDQRGMLLAMTTVLSQPGKPCNISISVGPHGYWYGGRDGIAELTRALRAGMTPIISYWSHENMLWMDGKGADGEGPCERDDPSACASSVKFYDFSFGSISSAALHASKVPGKRRLYNLV
eukprot:CAMPEP_0171237666 /NCGR_PEP_ID=MMETSP0790-20130122/43082_1 /TAXON_ID=2925 /ORGANISM="Alexandrium catenella, Strain OF101" /LENGTH=326 /DNA_ID=CAMNT_0011704021 /DNA_START=77 /DNA_END=1057 /DNA_ORIENTATION=+